MRERSTIETSVLSTTQAPHQSGFTLIEVLVSIVILSTGIVLVLSAMETSASALSAARTMSRAVFLCEHQLATLAQARAIDAQSAITSDSGTFADPFSNFKWVREVTSDTESVGDMTRAHQVSVQILRDTSDTPHLQFTTIFAQ